MIGRSRRVDTTEGNSSHHDVGSQVTAEAELIIVERLANAARLTLNRPDQLNPLDKDTIHVLRSVVEELEAEPAVRCVIVTGAGRAFSAGGDLKGYLSLYEQPAAFRRFLEDFHALCGAIESSEKIYLAAINGTTVAGGLELMLACDVVLAADSARIGDGHSNFAQLPGAGGSQRLPRAVGALRAKRLLLSGELLTAEDAERIGLVTAVVPSDGLAEEALAWAGRLSEKSAACLSGSKYLINAGMQRSMADALRMEQDLVHAYATGHPDAMEGLKAFAEKRPPRYRDAD